MKKVLLGICLFGGMLFCLSTGYAEENKPVKQKEDIHAYSCNFP